MIMVEKFQVPDLCPAAGVGAAPELAPGELVAGSPGDGGQVAGGFATPAPQAAGYGPQHGLHGGTSNINKRDATGRISNFVIHVKQG